MKTLICLFFIILFLGLGSNLYSKSGEIDIVLFYSPGCKECHEIKDQFLVTLREKHPGKLNIESFDITIMDNYLKLIEFENRYQVKENNPVVIFVNDRYFSGKKAILEKSESYLQSLFEKDNVEIREESKGIGKQKLMERVASFSSLVIISAGLIDGLNPCAFVTIVFLISFLSFVQKQRREIFIVGLVFSLAVFLTYLLLGLGLFGALHRLKMFSVVSETISVLAIAMLFILACFSLYDALSYLRFNGAVSMKLELPLRIKKKIHHIIRNNMGAKGLFFSVLTAGFLVSLLESICTGQVYFPAIVFMTKEPSLRSDGLFYLVLYNLAFIAPLLGVIFLTFLGITSKKFVSFSRANTFVAKLLLAGLFLGLGILLAFTGQ